MSTDRAFRAAEFDLEICTKIWASKKTACCPQAEAAYRRALATAAKASAWFNVRPKTSGGGKVVAFAA